MPYNIKFNINVMLNKQSFHEIGPSKVLDQNKLVDSLDTIIDFDCLFLISFLLAFAILTCCASPM